MAYGAQEGHPITDRRTPVLRSDGFGEDLAAAIANWERTRTLVGELKRVTAIPKQHLFFVP
jgi:hypothetical protein